MKKSLLALLVMVMVIVCSSAWADIVFWSIPNDRSFGSNSIGFRDGYYQWNEEEEYDEYIGLSYGSMVIEEPFSKDAVVFTYRMTGSGACHPEDLSNMILPIEYSEELTPVEVICYCFEEKKTTALPVEVFRRPFSRELDVSDISFKNNDYYFMFLFSHHVQEPTMVYMDVWPINKNDRHLIGWEQYHGRYTGYFNTRFIVPEMNPAVTGLSLDTTTTPKAGIPYELRITTNPAGMEDAVKWSVVNAGTTGAVITHDVLFTVGTGTVTLRATIPGGNADGTDYTQDFVLTVAPIANPIGANGVSGISANDLFSIGDTVSFTAFSAERNTSPAYGDYWYIPSRFAVHSENQLIGQIVNGNGSFSTEMLEAGDHTLTVQFTTMRYDGRQWVDAGNPYSIITPFRLVGLGDLPATGDNMNLMLWGILICVAGAVLLILKRRTA